MTLLTAICLVMALSVPSLQEPQGEPQVQDLEGYKLIALKLTNTVPLRSDPLRDLFFPSAMEKYDSRLIKEGLENIRQLYGDLGYIDFTYTPHLDINHNEKIVSCSFELIPGTRYSVNRIHIFGAGSGEEEKELKGALLLKENQFFSPWTLLRSIERLNELLETTNLALKDYEFNRSSDHPGTVDVSIWIQAEE